MPVLAIDCAQRFCAAALYDGKGGRVLASRSPDIGRGHAEFLPGVISEILTETGLVFSDIERIGVTVGPGSFAGIRVGVAFARGLAIPHALPVLGISSLFAMAHPVATGRQKPVMAAIDAKRERIWGAIVGADGHFVAQPAELTAETAAEMARRAGALIMGSASSLLLDADPELDGELILKAEMHRSAPQIEVVASLAAVLDPTDHPAEPAYLRSPDAKPQTGFAVEREAV